MVSGELPYTPRSTASPLACIPSTPHVSDPDHTNSIAISHHAQSSVPPLTSRHSFSIVPPPLAHPARPGQYDSSRPAYACPRSPAHLACTQSNPSHPALACPPNPSLHLSSRHANTNEIPKYLYKTCPSPRDPSQQIRSE